MTKHPASAPSRLLPRPQLIRTHLNGLLLLLLTAFSSVATAAIEMVISATDSHVEAAERVRFSVSFINSGSHALTLNPPQQLSATLNADSGPHTLRLVRSVTATPAPTQLPPGAVYQSEYIVDLPPQLEPGVISLTLAEAPQRPLYLTTGAPRTAVAATTETAPDSTTEDEDKPLLEMVATEETIDEEVQRNVFLDNISAYEPLYFLFGTNSANAKFQISFKYRFVNEHSDSARKRPWLSNFYMAYTQTSFWDLSSESVPFEDTNFKPELFYQFNDVRLPFFGRGNAHIDLRMGYQHESNGRDGDDSRSLNIAYLEPAFHWSVLDDYKLTLAPRVWLYTGDREGNPDIKQFRGRASLTATLGKADGLQLESHLRGNPSTGRGSVQFDLSYPISRLSFSNLDFYLYGQFFTGYGENLLNYNQKDTRFRLGLGIVR
ncbi:MAG: hypothetical protein Tsb002_29230 [Wenzhouxiangellaceae bacterium]